MTVEFKIPDEMVEAAAKALYEHDRIELLDESQWDDLAEHDQDSYRKAVTPALAAALSVCWVRQQHGVALDEQAVSACHSYCTNDDHERDRIRLIIQTPWREWSDD